MVKLQKVGNRSAFADRDGWWKSFKIREAESLLLKHRKEEVLRLLKEFMAAVERREKVSFLIALLKSLEGKENLYGEVLVEDVGRTGSLLLGMLFKEELERGKMGNARLFSFFKLPAHEYHLAIQTVVARVREGFMDEREGEEWIKYAEALYLGADRKL